MLAFELGTGVLRNESIEGYGMGDEGFVSGSLHFLPTEEGSGILVSLMAEKGAVDRPSGSDEWSGQRVGSSLLRLAYNGAYWWQNSFEYVMIYDIEHRTWYNQSTKPWDDCTWTGHCAGNFCVYNPRNLVYVEQLR